MTKIIGIKVKEGTQHLVVDQEYEVDDRMAEDLVKAGRAKTAKETKEKVEVKEEKTTTEKKHLTDNPGAKKSKSWQIIKQK